MFEQLGGFVEFVYCRIQSLLASCASKRAGLDAVDVAFAEPQAPFDAAIIGSKLQRAGKLVASLHPLWLVYRWRIAVSIFGDGFVGGRKPGGSSGHVRLPTRTAAHAFACQELRIASRLDPDLSCARSVNRSLAARHRSRTSTG